MLTLYSHDLLITKYPISIIDYFQLRGLFTTLSEQIVNQANNNTRI